MTCKHCQIKKIHYQELRISKNLAESSRQEEKRKISLKYLMVHLEGKSAMIPVKNSNVTNSRLNQSLYLEITFIKVVLMPLIRNQNLELIHLSVNLALMDHQEEPTRRLDLLKEILQVLVQAFLRLLMKEVQISIMLVILEIHINHVKVKAFRGSQQLLIISSLLRQMRRVTQISLNQSKNQTFEGQ